MDDYCSQVCLFHLKKGCIYACYFFFINFIYLLKYSFHHITFA